MSRTLARAAVVVAVGAAAAVLAPPVLAGPPACDSRANNTHAKLAECVTLEGVRAHQAALQAIADANGGTRAAGTAGLRRQRRVRRRPAPRRRLRRHLRRVPVHLRRALDAAAAVARRRHYETGVVHRHGLRHRDRGGHRRGPRPGRPGRQHQRLRGRGLRGLPRRAHRARPAGGLHLRHEGPQRRGGRRQRGRHLQPGQHPGALGPDHRHARPRLGRHPRRRRELRRRRRPRPGRVHRRS